MFFLGNTAERRVNASELAQRLVQGAWFALLVQTLGNSGKVFVAYGDTDSEVQTSLSRGLSSLLIPHLEESLEVRVLSGGSQQNNNPGASSKHRCSWSYFPWSSGSFGGHRGPVSPSHHASLNPKASKPFHLMKGSWLSNIKNISNRNKKIYTETHQVTSFACTLYVPSCYFRLTRDTPWQSSRSKGIYGWTLERLCIFLKNIRKDGGWLVMTELFEKSLCCL